MTVSRDRRKKANQQFKQRVKFISVNGFSKNSTTRYYEIDESRLAEFDSRHCDDLSDAGVLPLPVKQWVDYQRLPAHDKFDRTNPVKNLFAVLNDRVVKLNMASRFGDVGVTTNLEAQFGYERRVMLTDLKHFHTEL